MRSNEKQLPTSTKDAVQGHCEVMENSLWNTVEIRIDFWRLEDTTTIFRKDKNEGVGRNWKMMEQKIPKII